MLVVSEATARSDGVACPANGFEPGHGSGDRQGERRWGQVCLVLLT